MTINTTRRDRGNILPMVLVVTVTLGLVVVSIASYAISSLSFGRVAEDRSDRLAAADAGMRYAIDQIKLRNGCVFDTTIHVLPGLSTEFNDASAEVTCRLVDDGLDDNQLFALVITGEGVAGTNPILVSQSGSGSPEPKTLGGPVYLSRVTNASMEMTAPLIIEGGMLYYHDLTGDVTQPCTSITQASAITNAEGQLSFDPAVIYGPWCLRQSWKEKFLSPWVPDLTSAVTNPIRNGGASKLVDLVNGSYTDYGTGSDTCRVFEPGRYTTPPDVTNRPAYFKSGNYVFDFPNSNNLFTVKQSNVVMGNFDGVIASGNEINSSTGWTTQCAVQQGLDGATTLQGDGATVYLAGRSAIEIENGAIEIHARKQGKYYVSVQALCNPTQSWCRANGDPDQPAGMLGGDGGLATPSGLCDATCAAAKPSQLNTGSSSSHVLLTKSGNGKEFVAHGYFYAPLAKAEFGNTTNVSQQKLLGGLVAGKVHLQSSASATNFEIAVPTSPITGKVEVTAEGRKNGVSRIRAILQFRYEELDPDDRVRVNSWRVCEGDC